MAKYGENRTSKSSIHKRPNFQLNIMSNDQ